MIRHFIDNNGGVFILGTITNDSATVSENETSLIYYLFMILILVILMIDI